MYGCGATGRQTWLNFRILAFVGGTRAPPSALLVWKCADAVYQKLLQVRQQDAYLAIRPAYPRGVLSTGR